MLIYEYRIPLPITVEEYRTGLLWSTAEMSKNVTGGGEGVELITKEPFENKELGKGQYTNKIFHMARLLPRVIRMLSPKGSLEIHEKSWNCYPYCKTEITNLDYMKEGFLTEMKTLYKHDLGESENVHNLSQEELAQRQVVYLDITNPIQASDYSVETDPTKVDSGRGPIASNWLDKLHSEVAAGNKDVPYMCLYKVVKCTFTWYGLEKTVEAIIQKLTLRTITIFNRCVFCWMQKWKYLTMDDIRKYEDETYETLKKTRHQGSVSWFQQTADDDENS